VTIPDYETVVEVFRTAITVFPDDAFRAALAGLRDALGFDEIHLTGGEPTLHPMLAAIVAAAREEGYGVGVTSNGENGAHLRNQRPHKARTSQSAVKAPRRAGRPLLRSH
jgi:molybdenum cofactor biosynthesis enzyme MoaA